MLNNQLFNILYNYIMVSIIIERPSYGALQTDNVFFLYALIISFAIRNRINNTPNSRIQMFTD